MSYAIRRVDTRDPEIEQLLLRMQRECLPGDRPLTPKQGWWWIVYAGDGEPAGFASLLPSIRWLETGYLARAGVLPAHRGNRLQRRLIRVRMAYARRLGMKWLLSDTCDNPESGNSLMACGFRLYGPATPWGLRRSIYWRRRL